jgi:hypothetical protein
MILALLRFVAVSIGVLSYYVAFFMYEDEEGKWQDRIERLSAAINARARLTGTSKTSAFFDKIAAIATRGFNRVFGPRLFSFQLVGVSSSYSFAGLFLGLGFWFMILFRPSRLATPLPEPGAVSGMEYICLIGGTIFLLLGTLPALAPSRWSVALSLLPFLLLTAGLIKATLLGGPLRSLPAMFAAAVVSLLSDVILLALIRLTVRRISTKPSIPRIGLAVLVQVGVIVVLVIVPFQTAGLLMVRFGQRTELEALFCLGIFNGFTGLASSVFLLMLFFVMLHRAVWPVLGRPLYSLARHQVIRKPKIMASVGTACFVFAFPAMSSAIKGVLEWLAK